MTFYVATSLARAADADIVADDLRRRGWTQTYRWTEHGDVRRLDAARLAEIARAEAHGVVTAEALIVLLPGGRGTHTELGMYISAAARVRQLQVEPAYDAPRPMLILHSETGDEFTTPDTMCVFYFHPVVTLRLVGSIFQVADRVIAYVEAT